MSGNEVKMREMNDVTETIKQANRHPFATMPSGFPECIAGQVARLLRSRMKCFRTSYLSTCL